MTNPSHLYHRDNVVDVALNEEKQELVLEISELLGLLIESNCPYIEYLNPP